MRTWGVVVAAIVLPSTVSFGWPQPALGTDPRPTPELILTFDDGPDENRTPKVLRILKERQLQAIFFWVGHRITGRVYAKKRADVALQALRDGHIVGNHTVNHANLCQVDREKAKWEIDANRSKWIDLIGMEPTLFRAPYGADCRRLREMLSERGITHMHWDLDPQEWKHNSYPRTVAYLKRKLRNLEHRSVLLLHDTKEVSVKALLSILDWIDEEENPRRAKAGIPLIRIITPSQWLWEEHKPPVSGWFGELADVYVGELATAAGALSL